MGGERNAFPALLTRQAWEKRVKKFNKIASAMYWHSNKWEVCLSEACFDVAVSKT